MPASPSLLTLPPEIRLEIYSLVIGTPKPLVLSPASKINTWVSPPLSRTCRLLRQETIDLHFNTHDFVYDLRSPLDHGLRGLEKALNGLHRQGITLRSLRFKHVNRGVLSLDELVAWVMLFIAHRGVLPSADAVTFCQGPLRYREFAAQAAVALRQLAKLGTRVNENILGSGEESVVGEWVVECLERTTEGRVVMRGLRFAEEVVRGFRAAAAGEDKLGWNGLRMLVEGMGAVNVYFK